MEDGGGTGPHTQRRWNDERPRAATSRDAWRFPAGLSRLGTSRGYTGLETERSGPNADIGVSGLDPDRTNSSPSRRIDHLPELPCACAEEEPTMAYSADLISTGVDE